MGTGGGGGTVFFATVGVAFFSFGEPEIGDFDGEAETLAAGDVTPVNELTAFEAAGDFGFRADVLEVVAFVTGGETFAVPSTALVPFAFAADFVVTIGFAADALVPAAVGALGVGALGVVALGVSGVFLAEMGEAVAVILLFTGLISIALAADFVTGFSAFGTAFAGREIDFEDALSGALAGFAFAELAFAGSAFANFAFAEVGFADAGFDFADAILDSTGAAFILLTGCFTSSFFIIRQSESSAVAIEIFRKRLPHNGENQPKDIRKNRKITVLTSSHTPLMVAAHVFHATLRQLHSTHFHKNLILKSFKGRLAPLNKPINTVSQVYETPLLLWEGGCESSSGSAQNK